MGRSHEALDVEIFKDINRENERSWCVLHVFDSVCEMVFGRSWWRAGQPHNICSYVTANTKTEGTVARNCWQAKPPFLVDCN